MEHLSLAATRLLLILAQPQPQPRPRARDDRGDVPGWVLITVMTAGLVMAIWGIAKAELGSMLRDALASVHN